MNTVKTIEKRLEVHGIIKEMSQTVAIIIIQSFNNKTSIAGKLEGNDVEKEDIKIVAPLKYLINFCRVLDVTLMNCEVFL